MILGALAQAVPERVMACSNSACIVAYFIGKRPQDGSTWVYLETIGGGSGARATKDGLDGVHVHITNTSNLPVEALEIEYPADPDALRAGRGFRRRRPVSRRHGAAPGLSGDPRLPRAGRHHPPALAELGPVRRRPRRARPGRSGPRRGLRRRLRRAEGRPVVCHRHAGGRRLRPARRRDCGRRARSGRGGDQPGDGRDLRVLPDAVRRCDLHVHGDRMYRRRGVFGKQSQHVARSNGETIVGNDVSVQITNAATLCGVLLAEDYCRKNDRSARFVPRTVRPLLSTA